MHTIHHTEAFVIKSISAGEANKRVWLFTRDFGLVMAAVQGVRKPSAKLQGHISDYSYIKVDLVKGREVWRLIGADVIDDYLLNNTRNPLARSFVRSLTLIDRFLIDEGPHQEVFDHIAACGNVLLQGSVDHKSFDAVSLWRMLVLLGYIAVEDRDKDLMYTPLQDALQLVSTETRARLILASNTAIKESHL